MSYGPAYGPFRRVAQYSGRRHAQDRMRPLIDLRDGTFTRASIATGVSNDGSTVREYLVNQLVRGSADRYVFEGAFTNQTIQSEDIETTWAIGGAPAGSINGDTETAPEVDATADEMVWGAVGSSRISQTLNTERWPLSAQLVLSCFYKRGMSGGTEDFRQVFIDALGAQNITTVTPSPTLDWQRYATDETQSATESTSPQHRFTNSAAGVEHGISLWGIQSQHDHPYVRTSYLPTTTDVATRARDDWEMAIANVPTDFYEDGFYFSLRPFVSSADHITNGDARQVIDHTGSESSIVMDAGAATFTIGDHTVGTVSTLAMTWSVESIIEMVIDWVAQEWRYRVDGGSTTTRDISTIDWTGAEGASLIHLADRAENDRPWMGELSHMWPLRKAAF